MKFYLSLIISVLVLCNYSDSLTIENNNHKKLYSHNKDKQSIHLSSNKLLITETKINPIIINNNKEEENSNLDDFSDKQILDSNFKNKLKQAEKDLIYKLKKDKLREDDNINENMNNNDNNKINTNSINFLNNTIVINKNNILNNNNENSLPIYKITKIDTKLKINSEKTFAEVNEKIKFELKNGQFNSIIRKVSLAGSSDSLIAFKLSSNDIKLKEARIINNCFEENNNSTFSIIEPDESYLCVIGIFDEINAKDKNLIVEIEYEYIATNILRIRENNNSNNNVIVWYYDNFKRMQPIENINFEIIIENNKKLENIRESDFIVYPDKMKMENITGNNIFKWNIDLIKENDFQKISIEMPIFNEKCRKLVNIILYNLNLV